MSQVCRAFQEAGKFTYNRATPIHYVPVTKKNKNELAIDRAQDAKCGHEREVKCLDRFTFWEFGVAVITAIHHWTTGAFCEPLVDEKKVPAAREKTSTGLLHV